MSELSRYKLEYEYADAYKEIRTALSSLPVPEMVGLLIRTFRKKMRKVIK